ncbi:MAG TPA: potassium transporter Trk [Eubacteriaceae bacterium]|nr:potassium transporter Trk [Eubacteriaceae bacterium]
MKQFAVIGLGRFGFSLATALYELGYEVLAMDVDEERINLVADLVTFAVQADATDIQSLKAVGLKNVDVAIVAVASDINVNLMSVLNLQELEIEKIYAKAQSEQHEKVLKRLGLKKVFQPERDMGRRVAQHIATSNVLDLIQIDPNHSVIEISPLKKWYGKNLLDLNLRAKFGINVIAIKQGEDLNISPQATDVVNEKDVLVVLGDNKILSELKGGDPFEDE